MNQSRLPEFLVAATVAAMVYLAASSSTSVPAVTPAPPVQPAPVPPPAPPKPKPRRPWAVCSPAAVAAPSRVAAAQQAGGKEQNAPSPEPAVDPLAMPDGLRKRNIAASGLGCCVFRSLDYASHWQNVPALHGMPEWMVQKKIPGGGYPGKVSKLIPQIASDRGLPVPDYIQVEGKDTTVIELALKTGRLPCITWNGNHMLNCPYLDGERGAILDNNDPGKLHWFSRAEWNRKYMAGGGGWCVVLLSPGPSPPPRTSNISGPFERLTKALRPHGQSPDAEPFPPKVMPAGNGYRWEYHPEWGQLCLMGPRGHVGTYRMDAGEYYAKVGQGGSAADWATVASEPPVSVPGWALPGIRGWQPGQERYRLSGRIVSRDAALAALTDDSQLPYLTVIGPPAQRQQVLADLDTNPELASWKGKLRVQGYDPSEWTVASSWGFVTTGTPTIYLQTAAGKVLHRQDDYAGGACALALALRKADPSYQPAVDPNLSKPGLPMLPGNLPVPAAAVAGAAALVLLRRKAPHVS